VLPFSLCVCVFTFDRFEVLAGFTNAVLLLFIAMSVFTEAIQRIVEVRACVRVRVCVLCSACGM